MYSEEMWHRTEACHGLFVCMNFAGGEVCSCRHYHIAVWVANVAGRIGKNGSTLWLLFQTTGLLKRARQVDRKFRNDSMLKKTWLSPVLLSLGFLTPLAVAVIFMCDFVPSPAITAKGILFSGPLCVQSCMLIYVLSYKPLAEISPNSQLRCSWDELIRFWSRRVKGQSHNDTKYETKGTRVVR